MRANLTARTLQTDLRLPGDELIAKHCLVVPAARSPGAPAEAQKINRSILVPSLPARRALRQRLLDILEPQVARFPDAEQLVLKDNRSRQYGPKLRTSLAQTPRRPTSRS
ncbi:hypothetical protein [Roseateles sp.]|uniref:hypothetical protein n=1 Tax=Roseateles sp. TaxID=1971397 RepID=UPI00286B25B8|nr:hypothetical protein [Roseateles sp.]